MKDGLSPKSIFPTLSHDGSGWDASGIRGTLAEMRTKWKNIGESLVKGALV